VTHTTKTNINQSETLTRSTSRPLTEVSSKMMTKFEDYLISTSALLAYLILKDGQALTTTLKTCQHEFKNWSQHCKDKHDGAPEVPWTSSTVFKGPRARCHHCGKEFAKTMLTRHSAVCSSKMLIDGEGTATAHSKLLLASLMQPNNLQIFFKQPAAPSSMLNVTRKRTTLPP
jgi:hypothetical protein